ncbi:DUF1294 domain-containing protein [Romboutsia sedimentorum]|uniref:DUF1294 domain-containing protein n=1 Tax=Romboutsia sedimentorum TaxID=1368474 RepID=UPI0024DE6B56|nr:DUF1294 domain-containing protein [Romboutsia sedimentorum]MDK2585226.1 DUF1294 domain-containing protein [Romboutsia sedimentorum]
MKNLSIFYIFIINIISFIFMFIDKQKAIKHKWRISEYTLMLLAALGGSIGTLGAMYTFRHKTKKLKFKIGVPFIIIIQFLFLIFFKTKF